VVVLLATGAFVAAASGPRTRPIEVIIPFAPCGGVDAIDHAVVLGGRGLSLPCATGRARASGAPLSGDAVRFGFPFQQEPARGR